MNASTISIRDQQIMLFRLGFEPGPIDGVDGPKTRAALSAFVASSPESLPAAASRLPSFIESKNLTRANRPHSTPIDLIVIHTMESAEKPQQARAVARWFANLLAPTYPAPQASAHYCVDDAEVVQCVLECDIAWHAPGANHNGIGIEHSGFASQTPAQWDDLYSRAVLARSAELVAKLCLRFKIPMQWLTPGELGAGGRGIVGHVDCTNVFSGGRGHTDPGQNFPKGSYLQQVKVAAARLTV